MVVFLGLRTADKDGKETLVFGGTAFFIRHDGWCYLITARHVAESLPGPFVIGVNDTKGKLDPVDVDLAEWHFHEDPNVDVAVAAAGLKGDVDWTQFPSMGIADIGRDEQGRFGTGDLVYIVGLYRLLAGRDKILPVVHTGHLAMMPDEEIPIRNRTTGKTHLAKAYLVEAQTLEGLSGSPVFVRYSHPVMPKFNKHGMADASMGYTQSVFLLGLWAGAWDAPAGEILAERVGKDARVPVGMGLTIPAERIMEVLNCTELSKDRDAARASEDDAAAASQDSAFPAKSAPPATGADEQHKERFTSLLNAAARKRPPADQT